MLSSGNDHLRAVGTNRCGRVAAMMLGLVAAGDRAAAADLEAALARDVRPLLARYCHGLVGKQNLYHLDALRVPLVIGGPGLPEGKRSDALVYLYDLLPTLGGLCGVPGPAGSEGIDFAGSVRDPAQPARRTQVFAYRGVQRAICDDRWKLIRYPQVDRTQLFDLRADPHEATDLAGEPAHAAKVAELMALLEQELRAAGDGALLTVAKPKPADWSPPAHKGRRKPKT